jgi:hypothetical protein
MKRVLLLAGLAIVFAAGTASAQTSVHLSVGFGVPRPYVSGYVIVGRPLVRPVYRPYCYRQGTAFRHGGRRVVVVREPRRVTVVRHERERHERGENRRRNH